MPKPTINHSRRQFLGAAAVTFFLSISRPGWSKENEGEIVALRIWPSKAYTRITLESEKALKYSYFALSQPNRLAIDLKDVRLNSVLKEINRQIGDQDPYIQLARAGQFNADTVRIVFDLKSDIKPQVFNLTPVASYQHRLVIDLYPVNSQNGDPLLALVQGLDNPPAQATTETLPTPPKKLEARPDRRKYSRDFLVMIDPGHGGEDPGAVGLNGTREKDVVLKIATILHGLINTEPNMKAKMTRHDDVFIPLGMRVAKARQAKADLFISIHADAAPNRNARGSSVYALSEKGATSAFAKALAQSQNSSDLIGGVDIRTNDRYLTHTLLDLTQTATINDSLRLGKFVLNTMGDLNKLHKQSVEQAGFAVLKAPDIPSILVETAFISNPEEEQRLLTAKFQQQVANAIFKGAKSFFAHGNNTILRA